MVMVLFLVALIPFNNEIVFTRIHTLNRRLHMRNLSYIAAQSQLQLEITHPTHMSTNLLGPHVHIAQ